MGADFGAEYGTHCGADKAAFVCLSQQDKRDLCSHIAPLIYNEDLDEYVKRFDNIMYGLMLSMMENTPVFEKYKGQLCGMARKAALPQIREKLTLINALGIDDFWVERDVYTLETVRRELRGLVRFIVDEGEGKRLIYTNLTDEVIGVKMGEGIDQAYTFEDYQILSDVFTRNWAMRPLAC